MMTSNVKWGESISISKAQAILNKANLIEKEANDAMKDLRYNTPKEQPKVPEEIVEQAIKDNDIYSEVRELMLNAQRKQVAYGLEKYPETLNQDSWTSIETIEHIIEETVDQLHYLVMLKNKMTRNATVRQMLRGGADVDLDHTTYFSEDGTSFKVPNR